MTENRNSIKFFAYPLDVMSKSVTFYNLFRFVTIDDRFQTIENPAAHHVADSFLFNAKPLNLKRKPKTTIVNICPVINSIKIT